MRLSTMLIIPIVVTALIVSLVPFPSYDSARRINVNLAMKIDDTGMPTIKIRPNFTAPSYLSHINTFWAGSIKSNEPPANYSWHLRVIKEEQGKAEWIVDYYWTYSLRGNYWLNVTYSLDGEVYDYYTFIVTLHYKLPIGEGEVQGIYAAQRLHVAN